MKFTDYQLTALCIAKKINLPKVVDKFPGTPIGKRREFLTYRLEEEGQLVFVFSFGAIVFVNVPEHVQKDVRKSLTKWLITPVKKQYVETYVLKQMAGRFDIDDQVAYLPTVNPDEIEIAARVLAQSVALEYVEDISDEILANTDTMNSQLQKFAGLFRNTKPLLQLSAQNSNIIQFAISELSVLDKPDIVWDKERLETLFSQLADLFDIRSRFRNIEYKLRFAHDNSEFAFTVLESQRATFLELTIVLLIVFEIVLYFLDK